MSADRVAVAASDFEERKQRRAFLFKTDQEPGIPT
jgi:hypothetical protein